MLPRLKETICATVKMNPVTVASPMGKHTSLASSSNIGIIGIMKKPKNKEENTSRLYISVGRTKINKMDEKADPTMQMLPSFL